MTKAQLARKAKVSRTTIDTWISKGCPSTRDHRGRHCFEWEAVQRWRRDSLPSRAVLPQSYSVARARKEVALATLREIQVRVRQGELVETAWIMDKFFRACRGARDRLQNIPARTCGSLAAEGDQHKIFDVLTREIHDALEALFHEDADPHQKEDPHRTIPEPR
jgi:phage terminase Nu1 subunit (DNA packaging protein)